MAITTADVANWAGESVPTGDSLALLERCLAAVSEHVDTYYVTDDPLTDSQEQAVLMQSARLWRRRQSPDGVAAFGEFGPIRVSTLDPDVIGLLMPVWGFA